MIHPLRDAVKDDSASLVAAPGFGQGNVILIGDKVLALTDDGQLVVAKASPQAYEEVSRAKVLTGECWTMPALSNGRLFVRSTKEAACVDLSGS